MFPTAPPADVRPNARGRYLEKCTEITTMADLYTNPEPRPKHECRNCEILLSPCSLHKDIVQIHFQF